jgi:hypothetical protein
MTASGHIRRIDLSYNFATTDRLQTQLAPHTPPATEAIHKLI